MLKKLNAALFKLNKPKSSQDKPDKVYLFDLHPLHITGYLEAVWEEWRSLPVGQTKPKAVIPGLRGTSDIIIGRSTANRRVTENSAIGQILRAPGNEIPHLLDAVNHVLDEMGHEEFEEGPRLARLHWEHLIYAYLIENTRVVEVTRKLIDDLLHDEVHGALSDASMNWLRTTEDLFFRDNGASLVQSITSWVRPDLGATRRNAYQRMFGMDLNHGAADGKPYSYAKASIANAEFVPTLQELLRELWRGYVNANNSSGANATDQTNMEELLDKLQNMLNSRRLGENGLTNLAREEFVAVSMMNWFELTLEETSPIVNDMKAIAATKEDRLRKIGERVKLVPHGKSRSFFILAKNLPVLLTAIEEGFFNEDHRDNVKSLYLFDNVVRQRVLQIINHWSLATGVDLKATPMAAAAR